MFKITIGIQNVQYFGKGNGDVTIREINFECSIKVKKPSKIYN